MALLNYNVAYAGTATALAAPTTTETVDVSAGDAVLAVIVGATATTVTIVVPGTKYGNATTDIVSASLSNTVTPRLFRIPQTAADPLTQLVTVQFSQVTAVTAAVLR